jgi:hypothetical protein
MINELLCGFVIVKIWHMICRESTWLEIHEVFPYGGKWITITVLLGMN